MTEGSQEAVQVTLPPLVATRRSGSVTPGVSVRSSRRKRASRLSSLASSLSGCLVSHGGPALSRPLLAGLAGDAFGGVNGSSALPELMLS